MQMCVCLKKHKEHMKESTVLGSLHGLPGQRSQLEWSRLQQTKHATSEKHLVSWDRSICLNARTQMHFSKQPFT